MTRFSLSKVLLAFAIVLASFSYTKANSCWFSEFYIEQAAVPYAYPSASLMARISLCKPPLRITAAKSHIIRGGASIMESSSIVIAEMQVNKSGAFTFDKLEANGVALKFTHELTKGTQRNLKPDLSKGQTLQLVLRLASNATKVPAELTLQYRCNGKSHTLIISSIEKAEDNNFQ